ncbi:MAG: hypothetical protein HYS44_00645 [Candidatus Niyogibacteria bacterium]|nr:hypothetical protein [Candidatus Niyogibacteria bacterium]
MNPGETIPLTVGAFYNEDGFTCSPSDFEITLTVPQGWSGRVKLLRNPITLAPGENILVSISTTAPQNVNAGSYPVEVFATNLTTGTARKVIMVNFTVR